jgi:hypothetical protein
MLNKYQKVEVKVHGKVDNSNPRVDLGPLGFRSVGEDTGEAEKIELCGGIKEDVAEGEEAAVELVYRVGAGDGDDGLETRGGLAAPCGALPTQVAELVVRGEGGERTVDLTFVHERGLIDELLIVGDKVVKGPAHLNPQMSAILKGRGCETVKP